MVIDIRIQTERYNVDEEQKKIISSSNDAGALVLFQGMVRAFDYDDPLLQLELQHFAGLTEKEIERMVRNAQKRWPISACTVIHRIGKLASDEGIVLLIVTSKHRKEAFCAAEYIMDYLKTEAPFWKKETFLSGRSVWVEAKQSDEERKKQWNE